MKYLFLTVTVAALFVATTVAAGPPVPGVYLSTDLGGTMLPGRYSESWFTVRFAPGNTMDVQSYDDKDDVLATQWSLSCISIVSQPLLLEDTVDEHNTGRRRWLVPMVGGVLTLAGSGPWGNNQSEYTAFVSALTMEVTQNFRKGKETKVSMLVELTATVSGFSQSCLTMSAHKAYEVANTQEIGSKAPGTYPPFIRNSCQPVTDVEGGWGAWHAITMQITGCTTPVESRSWGSVKALYGN